MPTVWTNALSIFNGIRTGFGRRTTVEKHGGVPFIESACETAPINPGLKTTVYSSGLVRILVVVYVLGHPILVSDTDGLVLLPVAFVGDCLIREVGIQVFPGIFGVAFFNVFGTR